MQSSGRETGDKHLRLTRIIGKLWGEQKKNEQKSKSHFLCDLCSKAFLRRGNLAQHLNSRHSRLPAGPKPLRWLNYVLAPLAGLPQPESALHVPSADELIEQGYDRDVVGLVRQNWRFCCTSYRTGPIHKRYSIRLVPQDGFDAQILGEILRAIHANQTQRYKLNFSFAMILWNQMEKQFRFYWPGNAAGGSINSYYSSPVFINSSNDLERRIELLDSGDIMEHASLNRPDTRWIVHSLVNLHVSVYTNSLGGPLMGASASDKQLPDYLLKSRSIRTMFHNYSGKPFNDELCFFRCLSYFLNPKNKMGLQTDAHRLSQQFSVYLGLGEREYTSGISMENIVQAEKLFKIRIFIYSLQNDRQEASAVRLRSCLSKKEATAGDMLLDLYQFESGSDHLSLISNFAAYCKSYACGSCGYNTTRLQKLKRHERSCQSSPEDRVRGKGGAYAPSPTVFDRLKDYGISVRHEDRFSPLYSTWDLETFNQAIAPDANRNSGLVWESELRLLSCAVASNVPAFSETCFFRLSTDERQLVEQIVDYMISVSEEAARLNRLRLAHLFDSIDEKIEHFETLAADDKDSDLGDFAAARIDDFKSMRAELEKFADKHAFFSFNGSRFDVKVVRNRMCNVLLDKGIKIERIIKRDGAYVMLATEKMMLKDICCYLGVGISLDQWVRSYSLPVCKTWFPYEFVDSADVLDQKELPPRSAFYSSLKQSGISEEDYQELQRTYKTKGWRCLWDMLQDYNENDSNITLQALHRLVEFWKGVGFDLITEACSLPGLAVRLANKLTPSNKPFVQIPSQSQYQMHTWALRGVVGGPSIVFRQLTCANVTPIRQGPNICRRLTGFDANALYLHAMSQPMPTSLAYRWARDDDGIFKKTVCLPSHVSIAEVEFCMYLQHSLGPEEGPHLCWYFQNGQKRLGKKRRYSCDAVSFRLNTLYSFDGCHYHLCARCPNGRRAIEKNPEMAEKRKAEDEARDLYIERSGMKHVQMPECQWREMRKRPEIRQFLQEMLHTPQWGIGQLSESQLLSAVRQERFFGLLEVKMDCPDSLKEYFEECPPLFQNILLGRQHLNAEMLEVAEQNELLKQPRKCLVSVRSADSIILATPMLKWLMEHGMVCSKVHEAYEFKPFPLYKKYCEEVTRQRRLGDQEPHLKPVSDSWKIAGNGSYGRSLMRVDRFTKTICCDAKRASRSLNQKTFRQLEPLGDDRFEQDVRYEVTTLPRTFHETAPRCIGIFILQLAKLVLLSFYYDFLDKFWFREDFELVYSDTDSFYLSLSSASWQEHEAKIKPGMEDEYRREKWNYLEGPSNRRQTGVFKVEFEGELCIALCSKSYLCGEHVTAETAQRCRQLLKDRTGQVWNAPEGWRPSETDGSTKISAKGTNKKQNADLLRIDKFLDVLETKQAAKVCNRGFRAVDGKVFKYSLTKTGLSYFYGKRKLNPDFSTSPLW